jgi:cytochrome b subunit of formate dehydrogenase
MTEPRMIEPRMATPAGTGQALAISDRGKGRYYRRFSPVERLTHAVMMISFYMLVLTGVPLRFSYAPWARPLADMLGGVKVAGALHRFFGIVTFGYFALHIGMLVNRFIKSDDKKGFFWGPRSMVPQPKDLRDLRDAFRWFFGRGPRPQFDRYSYMDKFDYFADIWGVIIIGGSGLLLWFPTFFSIFLPGWMFNVATIVHGVEALIALCFIFTIHFFNVNLRPEKFPIDVVMFTGTARQEYFKEEHPLEYERVARAGGLAALETPPPSRQFYVFSVVVGFIAMGLGLGLVGLIVFAAIKG